MAYSVGLKRGVGSLLRRMRATGRQDPYSTSSVIKGGADAWPFEHGPLMFSRMFSVGASEQMNLIRQLREKTCAPIKDVKSSLVSCDWDIEAAHTDLRKRGVVLAMKKSGRTATEGLLAVAQTDRMASVVELNCETDFVARNEIFQYLASKLAMIALTDGNSGQKVASPVPFNLEHLEGMTISLDHPKLGGEKTVQNAITELAAMMGENVKLRRCFTLSTVSHGVVSSYLHTSPQPGLGRIAGLLSLEVEDNNAPVDAVQRVGSTLAMHIVAARPVFLSKELVSNAAIAFEREIIESQAETSGKPQKVIEKMVEGRLRKYFEEAVLLEQKFIMNDSMSVKSVLDNLSEEVGSRVKIGSFFRMEVGEGIYRLESSGQAALAQVV